VITKDPRRHSRYILAARRYLAALQHANCALCGRPVNLTLPRTSPWGPTIEHQHPVRLIQREARDWEHAVALVCDTSTWAVAHRRCNSRQGAIAANKMRGKVRAMQHNPSRDW
jgi:hypothetical protein